MTYMAGIHNYHGSPQPLRCGRKEPRVHRSRKINNSSGYQRFSRVCLKCETSRLSSCSIMPQCILINGLSIHRSRQYDLHSLSEELGLNLSLASNNNNNDASGVAEPQLREEISLTSDLGTTTLVDENTAQTIGTSHIASLTSDFTFGSMDTNSQQDIGDFLKKPFLVASGVLSASDDATTFTPYNMPQYLLSQDFFYQKLKGNLFFKGTLEFTLTVNANPFQQGRYLLTWCPTGGSRSDGAHSGQWIDAHTFSAMQRTQIPHVQLDLASQTRVTLEVPFVSAYSCWTTATSSHQFDTGQVRIYPYASLATGSGGSTTAGYSLWARFKDSTLSTAAVPNAGGSFSKKEQKSQGKGPVESVAKHIGIFASKVSAVPLLAPFAAPVAWAADLVSGVASVFGWAKPINAGPDDLVVRDFMYNYTHYDAVDNSKLLAYSAKNEVENIDGFAGTSVDELDFNTFLTIPSYSGVSFNWNGTQASGVLLNELLMSPIQFQQAYADVNGNTQISHTPVSFLSNSFGRWRGGFAITFKFVKTKFHAGRLVVAFNPGSVYSPPGTTTLALTQYLNRHIIDLREVSEYTINVPYVAMTPYLDTQQANCYFGYLRTYILDELTNPSTTASSIVTLIEVACLPDFEFAVPTTNPFTPIINTGINAVPHSGGSFSQSNGDGFAPVSDYIGSSEAKGVSLGPARSCIGERITSIRQILRIPHLSICWQTPDETDYMKVKPFTITCAWSKTTGIGYDLPNYAADPYSQFGSMFALSRGGVRMKFMPNFGVELKSQIALGFLDVQYGGNSGGDYVDFSSVPPSGASLSYNMDITGVPLAMTDLGTRGGLEFQVPAYSRLHSRGGADMLSNTQNFHLSGDGTVTSSPDVALWIYRNRTLNPGMNFHIARAMSDDGNFGGFVSIPPMLRIPNAS